MFKVIFEAYPHGRVVIFEVVALFTSCSLAFWISIPHWFLCPSKILTAGPSEVSLPGAEKNRSVRNLRNMNCSSM